MLEVFHALNTVAQLHLELRQGLAGQGRAGFGRIPLPSQGICHMELGGGEQGLRFEHPLLGQGFLRFEALELIELFPQGLGRALVFGAHFFVNLKNHLGLRLAGQPLPEFG